MQVMRLHYAGEYNPYFSPTPLPRVAGTTRTLAEGQPREFVCCRHLFVCLDLTVASRPHWPYRFYSAEVLCTILSGYY